MSVLEHELMPVHRDVFSPGSPAAGAGFTYTGPNTCVTLVRAFMDKVAHTYGQVQRNVHGTLKKALDPNGILAPGKSGIRIADNGKPTS